MKILIMTLKAGLKDMAISILYFIKIFLKCVIPIMIVGLTCNLRWTSILACAIIVSGLVSIANILREG